MKRPVIRRWLTGCGIVLLAAVGIICWYVSRLMQAFSMQNQVYQQIMSPDGRYMATLAYSDGMTFGFYFVCLQPAAGWRPLQPDDPIPHDEVAEVAAEGLDSIAWVGGHTLVVNYEKRADEEVTEFVLQRTAWRDIRIVYRGS